MIGASGWYRNSTQVLAHPSRMGGAIVPEAIVVHTTDCMPGSMPAILNSWSKTSGNGACAHAIIGRSPTDGVVQMIPFNRNGNHAGGLKHGWYGMPRVDPKTGTDTGALALIHPNTIAIGIELDCAGYLGHPVAGKWIHPDTKREVTAADVEVDPAGKGWHKVTQYQLDQLGAMIDAIRAWDAFAAAVAQRGTLQVVPNGSYRDNGVPWGDVTGKTGVVGHVTLDPTNKTDPGPFMMAWIRQHY